MWGTTPMNYSQELRESYTGLQIHRMRAPGWTKDQDWTAYKTGWIGSCIFYETWTIVPIKLPREHTLIKLADKGTRPKETKDYWGIPDEQFLMLQEVAQKQVTCDTFTNRYNARVEKFYSEIPCPSSAGINAFSNSWEQDFNWVCPPICLIPYTIKRIKRQKCEGILVVPRWPSAIFWPIITTDGAHLSPIFKDGLSFMSTIKTNDEGEKQAFKTKQTMMLRITVRHNNSRPRRQGFAMHKIWVQFKVPKAQAHISCQEARICTARVVDTYKSKNNIC